MNDAPARAAANAPEQEKGAAVNQATTALPPAAGFHLVRYFAVTGFVAFLIVTAALLYFEYKEGDFIKLMQQEQTAFFAQTQDSFAQKQDATARRDLLSVHETGNVNLTRLFANSLWEKDFAPFVAKVQRIPVDHCRAIADVKDAGGKSVQPGEKKACYAGIGRQIMALPEFQALNPRVFGMMKKSTVFKIKVYDLRGITAYSSEHGQIGEDKLGNAGWQGAAAGKPASELTHRDKFSAFEGVVENRDLISSYLPVFDPGSDKIVGVFEIYSDVTPFIKQIDATSAQIGKLNADNQAQLERVADANYAKVDKSENLRLAIVLVPLVLLYFVLLLVVRHGQRIIDKQGIERRRAEVALKQSHDQQQALIGTIDGIVWECDARTFKFTFVSPQAERLLGYPAERWISETTFWSDHIHPDDRKRVVSYCEVETRDMRSHRFEYRFIAADGRIVWLSDIVTVIVENNAPVKLRGLMVDVTARKSAETQLQLQNTALDAAANAIVITDREGTIRWVNRAFSTVTGYSSGEAIGQNPRLLKSGQHEPEFYRRMFDTLLGGSVWQGEIVNRRKDGHLAWEEMTITPMRGEGGEITHYIAIKQDISERKSQELKIARLSRIHAVLSGINSAIVRVRDRQELFNEACRIAVEHGNFGLAWIGLLDPATLDVTPVAWAGLGSDELKQGKTTARADVPLGQGVLGRAIRERKPAFDNDISARSGVGGKRRQEALRLGYRSLIVLPLFAEDAVAGMLALFAKELNFFDDEEIKLLNELAGDISFALEHIVKEGKLGKLSRIRAVSGEINAAIVRVHEREALLRETCRIAAEHGKFELVWVALLDAEKKKVKPVAWTGFSPEAAHAVSWASISAARGTLGEAIQTRRAAVRNDLGTELASGKLRQEALKAGCRSTGCLPLVVDGRVVALVALFAAGTGFFDEDELALLDELAADVSFALQSIARQEKLDYLSYYDALTGLPNRTLFLDRAGQQLRARSGEPRMVALILLDVERLRNINETLGRHGGDELLRLVSRRLEHAFNGTDYIARISADSFGVVIRGIRDAVEIAHAVESKVLTFFREPFLVNDQELRVAAKIGIAMFPTDGEDADTLFKNAEAALRKAKVTGERFLFYTAEMNAQAAQSLSLETRLRKAVEAQQFVLHYQPKVELASGRVCGLEALIRWNDPETGLVAPGTFIPLLEETGLILEVGRWALAQALVDYGDWTARGCTVPRIAINVSAIQLQQKNFVDTVVDVVRQAGNIPEALELEITESLLMKDVEASIRKLSTLRELGIHIAMDDFGTGYSSLSYVARMPINVVKIDRSFIIAMTGNSQDMAIVTTIIALAHSLNLRVVAEGVETEEQAQLLRLLKCDEMQGFLFSRPLPAAEVEAKFLAAAAA